MVAGAVTAHEGLLSFQLVQTYQRLTEYLVSFRPVPSGSFQVAQDLPPKANITQHLKMPSFQTLLSGVTVPFCPEFLAHSKTTEDFPGYPGAKHA